MTVAYLVAGVRTPIGRYAGALAGVRPDDLAAHVIRELLARHPTVDWARTDDVILGCANQAGEDNRNATAMLSDGRASIFTSPLGVSMCSSAK